ncbi:MAG: DUF131 domain-containing protein [Methanothrix sp.]|nr:DUF131 domain-containing protein [Methanothrix sp.]
MMLLLILGVFAILLGTLVLLWPKNWGNGRPCQPEDRAGEDPSADLKGGAVIMIGAIPIVMGSDPRMAVLMMIISLAIMVLWIVSMKLS